MTDRNIMSPTSKLRSIRKDSLYLFGLLLTFKGVVVEGSTIRSVMTTGGGAPPTNVPYLGAGLLSRNLSKISVSLKPSWSSKGLWSLSTAYSDMFPLLLINSSFT